MTGPFYTLPGLPSDVMTSEVIGDRAIKVSVTGDTPEEAPTLNTDAWGRLKSVSDRSILHAMFTYGVPVAVFKETFNGTEQAFTNAASTDGKLVLSAGATTNDETILDTYRNPRYQPNRGILYSSSIIMPSASATGVRDFGLFTEESGIFFRLEDGTLYACRRTSIGGTPSEVADAITLPAGVDLEKGNIFDIQSQWRGVGNIKFFINLQLVYTMEVLGTLTELSFYNPATPIAFRCENTAGANVQIQCGCVDVTSEGGDANGKTYGSLGIDNEEGQVSISGFNTPIIVVHSKDIVNLKRNTRDVLALLATGYADQRALLRIWSTRDGTAITPGNQSYTDFGDGHIEYISRSDSSTMSFDESKADLIFGCRVDQDQSYSTSALFEGRTEIWQTPGDYFIFTMHRETGGGTNAGVTYEFAEEI